MVTLCEVGQTEKEKYCTIPQRNNTNELIYKTETDSLRKQIYGYQREKVRRRNKLGVWD